MQKTLNKDVQQACVCFSKLLMTKEKLGKIKIILWDQQQLFPCQTRSQ